MTKFFRRIRQRLVTENKFSRYFIYAIGEIILIIIGILIALTINQKHTDRSNDQLRDLYLVQLEVEVDRNIEELEDYSTRATQRQAELDTLLELLVNKDYTNPNVVSKSKRLYGRSTFNPTTITYDNLKFSGDLKLFDDLLLRNSMAETYQTFNHIKTVERIDLEVVNVYYQDYYMRNAKILDLAQSAENFGKDDYFENTVYVRKVTVRQVKDAYERSIESLERLKSILSESRDGKL